MSVGAIGPIVGVGIGTSVSPVAPTTLSPSLTPSVQPSSTIQSPVDKVSLNNIPSPSLFCKTGIELYQSVNNLRDPVYIKGFIDGLVAENLIDPYDRFDEILAALLLALLLREID